jgi:hypothetical protein
MPCGKSGGHIGRLVSSCEHLAASDDEVGGLRARAIEHCASSSQTSCERREIARRRAEEK